MTEKYCLQKLPHDLSRSFFWQRYYLCQIVEQLSFWTSTSNIEYLFSRSETSSLFICSQTDRCVRFSGRYLQFHDQEYKRRGFKCVMKLNWKEQEGKCVYLTGFRFSSVQRPRDGILGRGPHPLILVPWRQQLLTDKRMLSTHPHDVHLFLCGRQNFIHLQFKERRASS